jgi:hypothetical protein
MGRSKIGERKRPTVARETLRRLDGATLSDQELARVVGAGIDSPKQSGQCTS